MRDREGIVRTPSSEADGTLGCPECPHYSYVHGPGRPCPGLDAAGDMCGCEYPFQPPEFRGTPGGYADGDLLRVSEKPTPPLDLWEKVDKMIEEAGSGGSRPLNSFTTRELSDRKGVSIWTAQRLVRKLLTADKVRLQVVNGKKYYTIQ